MRIIYIICLVVGSFSSVLAIEVSSEILVKGEPTTITTSEPTTEVIVKYRPNSQVVQEEKLTSAAPTQSFSWTPNAAGVVALSTETESANVSVRFSGASWSGIFIMLLAGLILFGGAYYAFRLLMNNDPIPLTAEDIEARADT